MRRSALVVIVVVVLGGIVSAQEGGNPHIQRLLDTFVNNCGLSIADFHKGIPAFARKNYSGKWFAITPNELEKCEKCFDTAYAWEGRDGRHVVQIDRTSESGDWYQYTLYCYAPDDELAGALSDLNTAWGWAVVVRFTEKQGKIAQGPLEFRDTHTWRRMTKMPDNPIGADEMYADRKPVMYTTLLELPFYALLKEKK